MNKSMNTDRLTVQMVVAFIGMCSLIIICGIIVLAFTDRPIPEPMSTLGGAAVGALGSLLARTATPIPSEDVSTTAYQERYQGVTSGQASDGQKTSGREPTSESPTTMLAENDAESSEIPDAQPVEVINSPSGSVLVRAARSTNQKRAETEKAE